MGKLRIIAALAIFSLIGCASTQTAQLSRNVTKGDLPALQNLVKSGGNINEPISNLTPLQWSVEEGKEDAVIYLIENGADVNTLSGGYTPLMLACIRGNIGIVKLLLSHGADLNVKDKSGKTAFYHARDNWNFNIAKLLRLASEAERQGGRQAIAKVCSDFKEETSLKEARFENYIDYQNIAPKISYKGHKTISITVQDKRPYVVSGQTRPEWVGITRGGFGRAYEIGTSTLRPLADELSRSLISCLGNAGFTLSESLSSDRFIQVEILEWLSVTGGGALSMTFGTDLNYEIIVTISDEKKNILVKQQFKGVEILGGSLSQIYELIPRGTESIYNEILNSQSIRLALSD